MNTKKVSIILGALMLTLAMAGSASAQTNTTSGQPGNGMHRGFKMGMREGRGRGVVGVVSSINGTTITVTSQGFKNGSATTTYTVDASTATVMKSGATSSISAIAVGDHIVADGTLSGTSVKATRIIDGIPQRGMMNFQGNGQPVIGGTVASISGATFTVTNNSSSTYNVDATNASVEKVGVGTTTVSNISTGDHVIVQGAINGTSVTASTVVDQGVPPQASTQNSSGATAQGHGFFGGIGMFFRHLFGF